MIISTKKVIGLIEKVILENGQEYCAKIDTGADSSSIDINLLAKLGDKKVTSHKVVRSALGEHKRPTVSLEIQFHGEVFKNKFSVSDRSRLKYKVLIGKDILKNKNFLIDPNK